MSTGDSKQTYTVEDIKSELRHAVRQLSEMTRSDASFDEFCQSVLAKLVKLTGGHGALLWQTAPNGAAQISHKTISPNLKLDISEALHRQAIDSVIQNQKPICIESDALKDPGDGVSDPAASPCLLLLAPVYNRKRESCGVLELLQRDSISSSAQDGYLKFLTRMAELFQRWHEHHDLARLSDSADRLSTTMDFVTEVHKSIDFKETAFTIANEARRLLNCDRVSFAKWNGSSCKVTAVSSQDRFDNRANVIRKLGSLATASVSGNVPLWITGETEGLPPEIVRRINDYMDESHSRTLAVIPLLKKPDESVELEFKPKQRKKSKKLGALIVEYFDEDVARDKVLDSVTLVTDHAQIASANALEHDQIFMRPLWKRLGDVKTFLFRDHFAKTMTGLAAFALLLLYLIFIPSELKMRVSGVVQPTERKNIFSKTEGVVAKTHFDQGDSVTVGATLVELENPDLDISIEETRGQISVAKGKIREVNSQLHRNQQLAESDRIGLWGRKNQFAEQLANLENRLELMQQKRSMQTIVSPIAGTVVTWDVKHRLSDLPVSKNQFVMSIANFDSDWQAELRIPQNQVGYVVAAMNENDGEPLDVEFRVATNPNILFKGKLTRLADRTDPGESGVPEFKAIVDADLLELKELRPGAGLTAKIHCGKHSTGFVWFYQVIDFLRTRFF